MPVRRRLAAVLAVLAVAIAPGAALAQSGGAGDDQYVDPIGGNSQQQDNGGSSNGSQGGNPTSPALSHVPQPAISASSGQAAPPPEPALPRTGLDAGIVALAGLVLVVAGVAVRLRLRDDRL